MKIKLIWLSVFVLALILRFAFLGTVPSSLDWDEASLGYNAYSILKTGRDEYGTFMPLSIRSFNDYKPPLYTYLTVIPVSIFGLNEFSTRFISAFFGTLTVIVGYFLIKELFPKKSFIFYLLFFIFFAISPWHIQFSRIAFEANLSLFFFVFALFLFFKGLRRNLFLVTSFIFFALSMYAYHSARLISPLMILVLTAIKFKDLWTKKLIYILSLTVFILMVSPIFISMNSGIKARFGSVTVINPSERLGSSISDIEYDEARGDWLGKLTHNRRIVYFRDILGGYLDHFNFDFLFLTGDPPGRHHAAGMGMLYFWDLAFILIGLFSLVKFKQNNLILFFWFLLAPLASSLTSGTPHAVRSLLYLPTYQIFAAYGGYRLIKLIKNKTVIIIAFAFLIFNFIYYLHMYYVHSPYEYAQEWQYGYKEVVKEVSKRIDDYDRVIVTYAYDQPYVYFLFYGNIDPSWYQKNWGDGEINRNARRFGKFEFRNIDWSRDSKLSRTLLVGTPGEIPEGSSGLIREIKFPDGRVAFRIVER